MLNEEKVKSMTKAAAYEKGSEKENIEISNYFRSDYLGLQMIKSALAYIAAFCLLVVIWFMMETETLMLKITYADYLQKLLKILLILFFVGLIAYEIIVYVFCARKYRRMIESVDGYQKHLKEINKFYETQESTDTQIIDLDLVDEEKEL